VVEVLGGPRSVLREPWLCRELGAILTDRIAREIVRPFDPEAVEMEEMARGVDTEAHKKEAHS